MLWRYRQIPFAVVARLQPTTSPRQIVHTAPARPPEPPRANKRVTPGSSSQFGPDCAQQITAAMHCPIGLASDIHSRARARAKPSPRS